jgi:hypothetical protein
MKTANRRSNRTPTHKARINSAPVPSISSKKRAKKNSLKKTNKPKKDNADPKINFKRRE